MKASELEALQGILEVKHAQAVGALSRVKHELAVMNETLASLQAAKSNALKQMLQTAVGTGVQALKYAAFIDQKIGETHASQDKLQENLARAETDLKRVLHAVASISKLG